MKDIVLKIIGEINIALDNNLYLVALNSALILPDICGKAEFPEKSNKARYINWYEENIGQYEQNPDNKNSGLEFPYLSGEVVYNLRCFLLHEGNPNITKDKGIDEFKLIIEKKNEVGIYGDSSFCSENGLSQRGYSANIRRLCFILCEAASHYYEKNKDKFNFFNYTLVDIDEEFKKITNNNSKGY